MHALVASEVEQNSSRIRAISWRSGAECSHCAITAASRVFDREGCVSRTMLRTLLPVVIAIADTDERVRGYLWETEYRWPSQLHIWLVKDHENEDLARRIGAPIFFRRQYQ